MTAMATNIFKPIRVCSWSMPGDGLRKNSFAICSRSSFGRGGGFRGYEQGGRVQATKPEGASSQSEVTNQTTKKDIATEKLPSWAQPGSTELPPWARNERPETRPETQDLPFFVYLIGSILVAIASVGSIFEYFNRNPIFGLVESDNPFYAPILGFFVVSGFPSAGFLWYKSIQLANKASAELDKEDGFLDR